MRSYEDVLSDIEADKSPFSNASEFGIWADRWCYDCANDDEVAERYCPVLSAAVGGKGWPREWTRRAVEWNRADGTAGEPYEVVDTCTEFEERRDDGGDGPEPEPEPPPVVEGQLDFIDAYLDTAIDELTSEPVVSR